MAAQCYKCDAPLTGNWKCHPTKVNVELGIKDGWFLSKSVGYASVYCNLCYMTVVKNYSG